MISAIVVLGMLIAFNLPQTIFPSEKKHSFILDVPFQKIKKSMLISNFEQETLKINNAELLQKRWIDKNINIQRPLKPDRYFEFSGRLLAKVRVDDPRAGKMDVELVEDIFFSTNKIEIKTQLAKPLSIGVSEIEQEILIYPDGQTTVVKLRSSITFKRFVPWFLKDYARQQVEDATDSSISKMESTLRNLK